MESDIENFFTRQPLPLIQLQCDCPSHFGSLVFRKRLQIKLLEVGLEIGLEISLETYTFNFCFKFLTRQPVFGPFTM